MKELIKIIILCVNISLLGQDGQLDLTFGNNGKVTTNPGNDDWAYGVAFKSDGRIIVGGSSSNTTGRNFTVVSYNSNGTLDNTFGISNLGVQHTNIDAGNDGAEDVAIQDDGKIILAGYTSFSGNSKFALVRYDVTGNLDNSFGINGIVTTAVGFGGYDEGKGVIVQNDQKIIVIGNSYLNFVSDYAIVRYDQNGNLDNSFGFQGRALIDINSSDDHAEDVAIQDDGKIIVTGYSSIAGAYVFSAIRLTPNGTLDNSFGTGGKFTYQTGTFSNGLCVAMQYNGKIILGGATDLGGGNSNDVTLLRLNTDGTLDLTFNSTGKFVFGMGDAQGAMAISMQNDSKIVVGAYHGIFGGDFVMLRLNPDGSLDNSFDTDGLVITDFSSSADALRDLAIQPDGKIVLAGWTDAGGFIPQNFALSRYNVQHTRVSTKLFLEGNYNSGSISSDLNTNNLIPLAQPYNSSPWNYTGSEAITSQFLLNNSNIVDWILLELRSGASADVATTVSRRAVFLLSDGNVMDIDGSMDISFYGITPGDYFLTVYHRNHLGIMSSTAVTLSN